MFCVPECLLQLTITKLCLHRRAELAIVFRAQVAFSGLECVSNEERPSTGGWGRALMPRLPQTGASQRHCPSQHDVF